MIKYTLIDEQQRSKLSEGRNYGLGCAFAKRAGTVLTTVDPISACKDYLSDRCIVEIKGTPYSACGLTCTKQDIFDTHAYLILSVLKQGRNLTEYQDYHTDVKALAANTETMQDFINYFEKRLKLKDHTVIHKIDDNKYVAALPLFWCEATYLISLYALLLRVGMYYGKADAAKSDPMVFLKDHKGTDVYMVQPVIPKLERLLAGERFKQDFSVNMCWHNLGIVTYQFPPVKA